MIDGLEIRTCREEDIASLEKVIPTGNNQFHLHRFKNQQKGDSTYLLAFLDGQPVGNLDLIWRPSGQEAVMKHLDDYPELNAIDVVPELRSRGIGSKLIDFAEELIRQANYEGACLGVATDNLRARQLYERLGYRDSGRGIIESAFVWIDELGGARTVTEHVICLIKMFPSEP